MSLEAIPHRRVYTKTTVQGNAHAILGDYHTHHHYYGALSLPRTNAGDLNGSYATSNNAQVATYRRETPLDRISDYDAALAHWLRKEARLPDTCDWIFSVPEYKRWRTGTGPNVLVCTGSVGCGKSVTASAVLDALCEDARQSNSAVVSYFVDSQSADKLSVDDILRAIVKQLVVMRRSTSSMTDTNLEDKLHALFMTPVSIPNFSNLLQLVEDLPPQAKQTYLLLDGIDAMMEDAIIRFVKMIKALIGLTSGNDSDFRIVIFCRESLGRGIRFKDERLFQTFQITLKHVQQDIHTFVDQQVSIKQDERCLIQSTELLEEVIQVLKANSAKMFLWVRLQVATLWDPDFAVSEAVIREQLRNLPEGLDQIYTQCLRRIEATNQKRSSEIAPKAFKWIATAARPLRQTEARELVSMESGRYTPVPESALSLPVTDYCCNLVVTNHLTGCLEFAHITVRDFLSDATKLPADLRRYLLKSPDTDLWCAYVLLPYIHLHRSKDQVVKIKEQKIPTKVTSPILRTVFTTLFPSRRPRSSILPLSQVTANPKASQHVALAVADTTKNQMWRSGHLEVHDYIREYWLWHTKAVPSATNPFFEDLCLSFDPDFLPWAAVKTSLTEKLKLAIAYAVTTGHISLFTILWNHMSRKGLQETVRTNPCPGTKSSYLHIAAALGHEEIVKELICQGFGGYADLDGKSAATIALEAGQVSVFRYLVPTLEYRYESSVGQRIPVHSMINWDKHEVTENILLSAVRTDDVDALSAVMDRCWCREIYLSEALFEACRNSRLQSARELIRRGASPDYWHDIRIFRTAGRLQRTSMLWRAVRIGEPTVLANLLDVGASLAWASTPFYALDVINHWDQKGKIVEVELFVKVVATHFASSTQSKSSANALVPMPAAPKILLPLNVVRHILSFLDDESRDAARSSLICLTDFWMLENHNTHFTLSDNIYKTPWLEWLVAFAAPGLKITVSSKYLRILLNSLPDADITLGQSFFRSPYFWSCLKPTRSGKRSITAFLECATDDVVARVLCGRLLNSKYLLNDQALDILAKRQTSRALEAFTETYLQREVQEMIDIVCDASVVHNLAIAGSIQQKLTRKSKCNSTDQNIPKGAVILPANWKLHIHNRLILREKHSVEAFLERAQTSSNRIQALIREMQISMLSDKLRLLRCCRRANDVNHLRLLYQNMKSCGSDAVFDLNFPAGYVLRGTKHEAFSQTTPEWVISKRITCALYTWNFRLRRKLRLSFSKADMWYMGSMIAKHFLRQSTIGYEPHASLPSGYQPAQMGKKDTPSRNTVSIHPISVRLILPS